MAASDAKLMTRDALVAASWANLVMLPEWVSLLQPSVSVSHWLRPSREACWAAVIVVLICALVGTVTGWLLRRRVRTPVRIAAEFGMLAAAALILDSVRVLNHVGFPKEEAWIGNHHILAAALASATGVALVRWRHVLVLASARILLILSPFLVVTIGRASFVAATTDFARLDSTPTRYELVTQSAGPRVVVVVFDELDYGLAFSRRPYGLRLDAFDRLRHEGFFATDVHPASSTWTSLAMPSLLTGAVVDTIVRTTTTSVFAHFVGDSSIHDLAGVATLFDDAAAVGAQSELVGWALPYCRWRLASYTSRCTWLPMGSRGVLDGPLPLARSVVRQMLAFAGPISSRNARIQAVQQLVDVSIRASADPTNRLVFLHLPVPHEPYIWDRGSSTFSRFKFRRIDYFANLALADHILAQLRQSVADAGLSDRTSFVVTADHGYRGVAINGMMPDHRVPFAVILPSGTAVEWVRPVVVVPLRRLVRALLQSEIQTTEELAIWMNAGEPVK